MVSVPPGRPILKSNITLHAPNCSDCLVAVSGEPLESYVTCEAPDATRANITVRGENASKGKFRLEYNVTEKDHMANVTCNVGNNDDKTVPGTTKILYVAGTSFCLEEYVNSYLKFVI